jgi:glyoxylase-like metal-dependent hydrolase (beta-lactamase superfamily II)
VSGPPSSLLPPGVDVLERGWLSANNILLHAADSDAGAVLVDTGYSAHVPQTLALVDAALRPGEGLRLIVNTHLHSDHCGGNAALGTRYRCPIQIPPGDFDAVEQWDESRLSFLATGQTCEQFSANAALRPGEVLVQGNQHWEVHAAPGHDPHSIILFEPNSRTLISADALWERGFGIVFPELDGDAAFDEVAETLDLIASLQPKLIIPGHGAAFANVEQALKIAREKLRHFQADPPRHALHGAKALTVFHMLEVQDCSKQELLKWLVSTPVLHSTWARFFASTPISVWSEKLIDDLALNGALILDIHDDTYRVRIKLN